MKVTRLLFALIALTFSPTVMSSVEVRFVESAPKDSFVITNNGKCDLQDFVLKIDLAATRGKLIFDTTASGAGVEVFQPFESREGGLTLVSSKAVADGDKTLTVQGKSLASKKQASFTIDVDDTLAQSSLGQIRVTSAEMQDGSVTLSANNSQAINASFDASSRALLTESLCAK